MTYCGYQIRTWRGCGNHEGVQPYFSFATVGPSKVCLHTKPAAIEDKAGILHDAAFQSLHVIASLMQASGHIVTWHSLRHAM